MLGFETTSTANEANKTAIIIPFSKDCLLPRIVFKKHIPEEILRVQYLDHLEPL
jgi:hypothetical protein